MPRPTYPADIGSTLRGIADTAREAWTGAQSRVRYAVIRAAAIIVGAATGNRITIQPDSDGTHPRVEIQTEAGVMSLLAVGDTIALITGTDPQADDITYVGITSAGIAEAAVNVAGARRSSLRVSQDWARLEHTQHGAVLIDDLGAQLKRYGPQGPTVTELVCTDSSARMRARDSSGGIATDLICTDAYSGMRAFDSSGGVVAALSVQPDGRIAWTGTWDPPP